MKDRLLDGRPAELTQHEPTSYSCRPTYMYVNEQMNKNINMNINMNININLGINITIDKCVCIYIVFSSEPLILDALHFFAHFHNSPPALGLILLQKHIGCIALNSRHEVRAFASGPPAARRKPRHLADGMSKLCQAIRGLAEPVRLSGHDWHLMIISIGVSTSACTDGAANLPSTGNVTPLRKGCSFPGEKWLMVGVQGPAT